LKGSFIGQYKGTLLDKWKLKTTTNDYTYHLKHRGLDYYVNPCVSFEMCFSTLKPNTTHSFGED